MVERGFSSDEGEEGGVCMLEETNGGRGGIGLFARDDRPPFDVLDIVDLRVTDDFVE